MTITYRHLKGHIVTRPDWGVLRDWVLKELRAKPWQSSRELFPRRVNGGSKQLRRMLDAGRLRRRARTGTGHRGWLYEYAVT